MGDIPRFYHWPEDLQLNWNWNRNIETPNKAYHYRAGYAADVHDGDEGPARPWLMTAAVEYDFEVAFLAALHGRPLTPDNLELAWKIVAEWFEDYLHETIHDERWYWPNETRRQSGEIAGDPRDVVDTGNLDRSLDVYDL